MGMATLAVLGPVWRGVFLGGVVALLIGLDRLLNAYWMRGTLDALASCVIAVGLILTGAGVANGLITNRRGRARRAERA